MESDDWMSWTSTVGAGNRETIDTLAHAVTTIQQKKEFSYDVALQSRKSDTEKIRSSKRDKARNERRAGFPVKASSLAIAAAAGNDAPVARAVDSNGESVDDAQLQAMISEVAARQQMTYDQVNESLTESTNPQAFVDNFHFFLNNPASAWLQQDQEEEITFENSK